VLAARPQESEALRSEVVTATIQVQHDKENLVEQLAKTEEARHKLSASEIELKKKVESFQRYLDIVQEQGILPEAAYFRDLLRSVKRMSKHKSKILKAGQKQKVFISYAWDTKEEENAALQAKLTKLKGDLERCGIKVLLDIHHMEGDIDHYMKNGIEDSDRVLLICTPRLAQRADEQMPERNNLQKELDTALAKQKLNPNFIIPIIMEGNRSSAIAKMLPNILSMDFTDPRVYYERMVALQPKGLIPMLMGLDYDKVYDNLLSGYYARVELLKRDGGHSHHLGV